jgi:hypothetical protein
MFEVIKNLKPAHRLQAFLFAAFLTTSSAILTVYLKTDDCSGLAKQYEVLVKNYTETMSINNTLIESNNKKDRDMIAIRNILDEMSQIKPESITKITTKTRIIPDEKNYAISYNSGMSSTAKNDSGIFITAMPLPAPQQKVIETRTTIVKLPEKQKMLTNSIKNIIAKYIKK